MPKFKKIADLTPQDRTKVDTYWTPLFGAEFAKAMTTDFTPEGKKKKVKAKRKSTIK